MSSVERNNSSRVLKGKIFPYFLSVALALAPFSAFAEGENFPDVKAELTILKQDQPKDWVAHTQDQVEKAIQEQQEEEKRKNESLGENTRPEVKKWEKLIIKYARISNVDPVLVAAVMMVESRGVERAYNNSRATGLMQVVDGPWDPEANIAKGVEMLAACLEGYSTLDLAIACYNAGPPAIKKYGGVPPYKETHEHIRLTREYYSEFILPVQGGK